MLGPHFGWYANGGKRVLDLAIAGPVLAVLSPVLVVLAIAVRRKLGPPALFRQTRPGLHGRPFTIFKFRTMTDARDEAGHWLPDADRLTPFGRWLRATSLDELPELINVLRGEMSLVGPRPLLMAYLERYDDRQIRRHAVRPGITGLAQVRGRNALEWSERFELDLEYVQTMSLTLDLRILVETLMVVARSEGITEPGHATKPDFHVPDSKARYR